MIPMVSLNITRADDEIHAELIDGRIPVIRFGSLSDNVALAVNSDLLTRNEQARWLIRLSRAAAELAAETAAHRE